MTQDEHDELRAYLRGLQTTPHTIFVGFSARTTLKREFRDRLPREMAAANPDCGGVAVLEMGRWLAPDEYLVAEPDDDDTPTAFFVANPEHVDADAPAA